MKPTISIIDDIFSEELLKKCREVNDNMDLNEYFLKKPFWTFRLYPVVKNNKEYFICRNRIVR